jgi:peptidoglycan/LPS O-acetylase OafA/YrhL
MKPKINRLAFLDVGRGIAAMAVVLQHVCMVIWPRFEAFSTSWFAPGRAGVFLFFLISGFVIPFTMERQASIRAFWINRSFRLYPLYWASLILTLALVAITGVPTAGLRSEPLTVALVNVTMLQAFVRVPDALGFYWTLGYEMAFYGLMTALAVIKRNRQTDLLVVAYLVYLVLKLPHAVLMPASLPFINPAHHLNGYASSPLAWFSVFIIGTLVYRAWTGEYTWSKVVPLLGGWLGLLGINFLQMALFSPTPEIGRTNGLQLLVALFVFAILYLARNCKFPTLLTFLGRISYSIYLIHGVLLVSVGTLTASGSQSEHVVAGALVAFLTIPISVLTYRYIEAPAIALGKRLASRKALEPALVA